MRIAELLNFKFDKIWIICDVFESTFGLAFSILA